MSRRWRLLFGLAIVAAGVVLVFAPLVVAEALGRPHGTPPERINLRASWGGSVVGVGVFIAWLPALRPWTRSIAGLLGWSMAAVGAARVAGFVLDGGPDTLQWVWLGAEVVIAAACIAFLRRSSP